MLKYKINMQGVYLPGGMIIPSLEDEGERRDCDDSWTAGDPGVGWGGTPAGLPDGWGIGDDTADGFANCRFLNSVPGPGYQRLHTWSHRPNTEAKTIPQHKLNTFTHRLGLLSIYHCLSWIIFLQQLHGNLIWLFFFHFIKLNVTQLRSNMNSTIAPQVTGY